ncbi:tyrosine-protein phosphatase [Heliophilum fasciatum]|uniref:tyrosine-protein phosphatase n=1 Tax=Heliophilum fasciatum TaxID=35700 RepID=UPI00104695FF|nr:CpsB/CapC family capsule biosynthesis tyrosine phosphatase [Heliophilum fasciatum]MCW2278093.1 protein-tyrosine phosphatase [Heliophilum fasciatum]
MKQPMEDAIIDLHCHILPGIDDGAPDLEESLAMARQAFDQGVRTITVTPHFLPHGDAPPPDEVRQACAALQAALTEHAIELELLPGHEVYLTEEVPRLWREGKLLPLTGEGNKLLVELPLNQYASWISDVLFELQVAGAQVVIAHPERYRYFRDSLELLEEWVARGTVLQVNAGSIVGHYGESVFKVVERLFEQGLVSLIGSDAHSSRRRTFLFDQASAQLHRWGIDAGRLYANHRRLLAGEELDRDIVKALRPWWRLWA